MNYIYIRKESFSKKRAKVVIIFNMGKCFVQKVTHFMFFTTKSQSKHLADVMLTITILYRINRN